MINLGKGKYHDSIFVARDIKIDILIQYLEYIRESKLQKTSLLNRLPRSAEKRKVESVAMWRCVCLRMSRVVRASFRGEGIPVIRRVLRIQDAPAHELKGGERGRWNAGRYAAYYPPISVMSFVGAKWLRTSKGGIFSDGKARPPPLAKVIYKGNPPARGPRIKEGLSNKNKPGMFVFS